MSILKLKMYVLKVVDRSGKVLREHKPGSGTQRAISYESAATMLQLMRGVVEEGSGRRIRSQFNLEMDVAGKTGTTQDHADGWFIGITPDLVTGVWVGAEDPAVRFRTLALGQGANTALPIWGAFMAGLTRTEAFEAYRYSRFAPVPREIEAQMSCMPYQEATPVFVEVQEDDNFLERLFGRIKGRDKDHRDWKKERDRDENRGRGKDQEERWGKEDEWQRERDQKREEHERESEKKWQEKERERQKKQEEKQRERDREREKDREKKGRDN